MKPKLLERKEESVIDDADKILSSFLLSCLRITDGVHHDL